ncbi:MAG: GDSL-type esterase/lipase family protein [Patulibacter sp.]
MSPRIADRARLAGGWRCSAALLLCAAAFAVVLPHQARAASLPVGASIVALGDSIAAGEAIGDGWQWDGSAWAQSGSTGAWETGDVPAACHQSVQAYPRLVAQALDAQLLNLACTGATIDAGVLSDGGGVDPLGTPIERQLGSSTDPGADAPNPRYDAASPDVVLLSIGANDVGLVSWLQSCYDLTASCAQSVVVDDLVERLSATSTKLDRVLNEIARRGAAAGKQPAVLISAYADPFPLDYPAAGACADINPAGGGGAEAPGTMSADELAWAHQAVAALNSGLAMVAAQHDGVFVVGAPELADHRYCSADPWFFGPSIAADDWAAGRTNAAPFHPTAAGQRALADQVLALVGQAVDAVTAGPTATPTPTPSATPSATPTATPASAAAATVKAGFGGRAITVPTARRLRLTCAANVAAAGTRCRVTVRLGRTAHGAQLAVKTVALPAGTSSRRVVTVKLSRAAWRQIGKRRRVRVSVTLLDAAGTSLSSAARIFKVRASALR